MDRRRAIIAEIPRLRRFARALAHDPAAADDLVQDCLERALARLHQWRDQTSMRAWLLTILRNLHRNRRRDTARRPREVAFDEERGHAVAAAPVLAIRDLSRALDGLPDPHREVVLLIGLEGMSYRETAQILDIPVGTVMSRLSRGRQTLKRLMDGGDPAPTLRRVK